MDLHHAHDDENAGSDQELLVQMLLTCWRHLDDEERWRAAVIADRIHQHLPLDEQQRVWVATTIARYQPFPGR